MVYLIYILMTNRNDYLGNTNVLHVYDPVETIGMYMLGMITLDVYHVLNNNKVKNKFNA